MGRTVVEEAVTTPAQFSAIVTHGLIELAAEGRDDDGRVNWLPAPLDSSERTSLSVPAERYERSLAKPSTSSSR